MVRFLAVADVVDPALEEGDGGMLSFSPAPDAVVSCGDLPADYLATLARRFGCPVFYVRGNHDGAYDYAPPEGCVSIDGRLFRWRGVSILGLGGAPVHNGGTEQYSERAMRFRILRRRPGIWRLGGLDVVVSHAGPSFLMGASNRIERPFSSSSSPPPGTDLFDDPAHRGFRALGDLVRRFQPVLLLHGHTHRAYVAAGRERLVGATRIVNAYGHCLVDVAPRASGAGD